MNMNIKTGIIVKAIGGIYFVETHDGIYECKARGIFRLKEISPCCGDNVELELEESGTGMINKIFDRKNYLIRPPLANLDQLFFVTATCEPSPNILLLDKFIAIAEFKAIKPIVILTKIDIEVLEDLVAIYENAGIMVISVDNTTGNGSQTVKDLLFGKISAFTGNTGVGKSTLLNNIAPNLDLKTDEISKKLGRGKHTTRHVQLYKLDNGGYIADTPGFSTFDTQKYDYVLKDNIAGCFREFEDFVDKCKFQDCSHTKEKGCAVIEAVNNSIISSSRHNSYIQMYEEAKQIKEWEHKNK